MSKSIADYTITLFLVGNQMLLEKDGYEKPYMLYAKPFMAKETNGGYVLLDGNKRIKKEKLMVFKNEMREICAEFAGYCLPDQVEEAKAIIVEQLRAHNTKYREMFAAMLKAVDGATLEYISNSIEDNYKSRM